MSYNGKFVSFTTVVEKVYRDSGLDSVDFENAIEWTAELFGLIGTPHVYIDKVTDGLDGMPSGLKVENYRCKLPDDCEKIYSIRKANIDSDGTVLSSVEMLESTNIFHPIIHTDASQNAINVWNPLVNVDTFDPATESFEYERSQVQLDNQYTINEVPMTYKIDQGYIYTSFTDGYLILAYKGFPIDSYGLPLIPDDEKFKQALKWYITANIDRKNWRINPSPQNKSILNDSEQQRDFYVAAARNKSHIPSLDKMESIKNMWLRSITKVNEHKTGFATLSAQEQRYNQRYKPSRIRRNI